MPTTLNIKNQITIAKQIRDSLGWHPGTKLDFAVNRDGEVVLHKVEQKSVHTPDRFEIARGKAEIRWCTQDLMALLRGES